MSLAEGSYHYDPQHFLITSLNLPAGMQVLEATEERPYLGLALKLDLRMVGELTLQAPETLLRDAAPSRGMVLGETTPALLEAFQRLVALLDEPLSIPMLAPLIQREICWRDLISEQGERLRQIVSVGSQGHRVARTLEWLRGHY